MSATVTSPSLPLVFVNGQRVGSDAAAISTRDRGLTLADGLFETMRVRHGVVFRLDRHLARLSTGLRTLAIPEPAAIRTWIERALQESPVTGPGEAGHHAELSMRVTVTRGPGPAGLAPPLDAQPTVIIAIYPMPAFPPAIYERGLRAHVASGRRNERSMTAGLKTIAYTDAVVAWLEAQRAGAEEAIFLDTEGHCSEASASNLFVHARGALLTPPVTCAALPGITRATVIELAASLGMAVHEEPFDLDTLARVDEAFLTSSLRGIAPLCSVDGHPIGAGRPGPVTKQVTGAYRRLVAQGEA